MTFSRLLNVLSLLVLTNSVVDPMKLLAAAAPHKAIYTFGGLNERSGILWVARDAGIFQKHGIDPTIVNVRNAQVKTFPDQTAVIDLCIDIRDHTQLERTFTQVRKMSDVLNMRRISQAEDC